ncbi:MAG: hypothetical protein RIS28_1130 [Bacteroidota bacterium]
MSIKYLEHEQIDPEKWNAAVLSSETPLFYALFGYLDCVTENRWDALVFNEYEAVFPLPYKINPFFVNNSAPLVQTNL